MKKTLKPIILSLCMLSNCFASGGVKEVELAAEKYFYAMKDRGILSTAEYMHPDALKEFKDMMLPVFIAEAESGQRQMIDITYGKNSTIDNVKNSTPNEFMASFMRIIASQLGSEKIGFESIEILGSIKEKDTVHVLARMTVSVGDLSVRKMEVISFLPYQDGWGMLLNGSMEGIAKTLRARVPR